MTTAGPPTAGPPQMPHQLSQRGMIMDPRKPKSITVTSPNPTGSLLYAVPAPGSAGKDLLCLCRKVYWTSGSLMYCAYTPVTKEEAAILLKDPSVINILSNPVPGTNLLTVAANGAIIGVQQTVGYINTSTSKELEAHPKKPTLVPPSSVSPSEAEKAPAKSPALPQATATLTTAQKNHQSAKPVVSKSCTSMMPKIDAVFTLADTNITTNSLPQKIDSLINTKVPDVSTSQHPSPPGDIKMASSHKPSTSSMTPKFNVKNDSVQQMRVSPQNMSNIKQEATLASVPHVPVRQVTPVVTELTTGKNSASSNFHSASTLLRHFINEKMQNLPVEIKTRTQTFDLVTDNIYNLQSKTTKSVSSKTQLQSVKIQNLPKKEPQINTLTRTPDQVGNDIQNLESKLSIKTQNAVSSKTSQNGTLEATSTVRKLSSVLPSLPVAQVSPYRAKIISKPHNPLKPMVVQFKKSTSDCFDASKNGETNSKVFNSDKPTIRTKVHAVSSDTVMNLSSKTVAQWLLNAKAAISEGRAKSTIFNSSSLDSSKVDKKSPAKVHLNVSAKPPQTITPKKVPQSVQPPKEASPSMKVPAVSTERREDKVSTDLALKEIVQEPLQQKESMELAVPFSDSTEELMGKVHNVLNDVQNKMNNNNVEVKPTVPTQEINKEHDHIYSDIKDKVALQPDIEPRVCFMSTRGTKRKSDEPDAAVGKEKRTTRFSKIPLTSESESESNSKLKVKFRFSRKMKGSKQNTCSTSLPEQSSSEASKDLEINTKQTVYFPDGPITINNAHGFKFELDHESKMSAVDGKIPKLKPLKKLTAADAIALGCNHSKACPLAPDGFSKACPSPPDGSESSQQEEKVKYEPEKASTLVALTRNPDFSHITSSDRVAHLKELQRMQRAALGMI